MNLESELKEKNLNRSIENISLRAGDRPGKAKNNNFIVNNINESKFK